MQLDRFTQKAQEAIVAAQELAQRLHSPILDAEHLLSALVEPDDGIPAETLRRLGVDLPTFRGEVAAALARRARIEGGSLSLDPRAKAAIERAEAEARRLGDEYVSTEHLLLGVSRGGRRGPARSWRRQSAGHEAILQALQSVRGGQRVTSQNPEGTYAALEKYGRDLTAEARAGKLDPVIGRDEEIRRVIQVLSRRTKNNPVLIGEPGRRQDGHRRGPRPAHHPRRRARGPQGQAGRGARPRRAHRRRQVPRRVRGAAQGRAQGDQGLRRPGRPVHRRAAHGRRRRRRRGRHGRVQPAQADARPRRAAHHRRDDARRVPQAHREGRRAGAPLPAGPRRPADGRGDDLHPARPARALRGPPRRAHHRLGARRRGDAVRPLHHRALPAGQGHRPRRRVGQPAAHGDRLDADRARRARAPADPARDRARGPAQGDRRRLQGAPRGPRARAGRPRGGGRRPQAALGGGEGRHRRHPRHQVGAGAAPGAHRAGRARGRLRDRRRAEVRRPEGAARPAGRGGGGRRGAARPGHAAQGGGRRGRHRRDRRGVDRASRSAA